MTVFAVRDGIMFTGLVQATGRVLSASPAGGGKRLEVDLSRLDRAPAAGASVAVDGACLTVAALRGAGAVFDVSAETASRTTLGRAAPGQTVNLEPSLRLGDEVGGHFVPGHVDAICQLVSRRGAGGGAILRFSLPDAVARLVAFKGSVAVAGVSLTVSGLGPGWFEAAAIPETLARTTLGAAAPGGAFNLEADVLARYAARWLESAPEAPGLTPGRLAELGF